MPTILLFPFCLFDMSHRWGAFVYAITLGDDNFTNPITHVFVSFLRRRSASAFRWCMFMLIWIIAIIPIPAVGMARVPKCAQRKPSWNIDHFERTRARSARDLKTRTSARRIDALYMSNGNDSLSVRCGFEGCPFLPVFVRVLVNHRKKSSLVNHQDDCVPLSTYSFTSIG